MWMWGISLCRDASPVRPIQGIYSLPSGSAALRNVIAASGGRNPVSREKKTEPQQTGDLDLSIYREKATEHPQLDDLSKLSLADQKVLLMSGVDPSGKERVGSFFQKDHSVVHCRSDFDGAGVMSSTTR